MLFRSAKTAMATALALVAVAPAARAATPSAYVYATSTNPSVSQFSANDAGDLSALSPATVPNIGYSAGAATSPDGRSLYIVDQTAGQISQFDIAFDGTIAPKSPATVATGATPFGIAVAPDGDHVYVTNQTGGSVWVYDVGAGGTLSFASQVADAAQPIQIALSPDGASAYVTNFSGASVSQYDIDATTGALTPKTSATVAAGGSPVGIAVSPDGGSAYVANRTLSGTISQFSVGAGGALTAKTPASVSAGSRPVGVVAGADGVYATNYTTGTISQYTAGAGGALTAKTPDQVSAPSMPYLAALAPDGHSLYVAGYGATAIGQYDVGTDGTLTAKSTPTVHTDMRPIAIAVAPGDQQAPTIDLRTPADGAHYALGDVVDADYSCADQGNTGLQSCTGDVADGAAIDTSTLGDHDFTVVARDGAGNETTVKHTYAVVDDQAPTIDLTTPADGAVYEQGADVHADYSCADEGGSGVASCTGDVPDGEAIDTSTVGPHDFTVTAHDGAGNETTVTHHYTVVGLFDFEGFLGPIHDGSVVHAGDSVPIVFSLGGDRGLDVLADGSPSSVQVDCDDPGEPTGGDPAASSQGLRYNASTGHYVFRWETDTGWAGTCRSFVLTLADGSVHRLLIKFCQPWSWRRL
jgi:6-phosphogluconolactonase (cycloisomerase 2 family)